MLDTYPKILIDFELTKREDDLVNILILNEKGIKRYFELNDITASIIKRINNKKTFEEICKEVIKKHNLNLKTDYFFEQFKETEIFTFLFDKDSKFEDKSKVDSYIFLKTTIIPAKVTSIIAQIFSSFYAKKFFWISFCLLPFVLIFTFYIENITFSNFYDFVTIENALIFSLGYILSVILHEVGHAAAAINNGAITGKIGFGFYLVSPVFYCDVTDVWRLKKWERIQVDLAGVYFQWWISLALLLLFFTTNLPVFIYFSFFNFLSSLFNLNPLLRYDGYWAFTDYLQISNLRGKSTQVLIRKLKGWVTFNTVNQWNKKDVFLFIYALFSWGLIGLFLYYILFKNPDSVIYYWANIWDLIKGVFLHFSDLNFDFIKSEFSKLLAPTIFYFLIIKIIINKFKTNVSKLKKIILQH